MVFVLYFYLISEDDCGFKKSTQKKDEDLQFVPCNLHIQRMKVIEGSASLKLIPDLTIRSETPKESSYYMVTFGAPADHVRGFKNGGLKKLLQEIHKQYVT